MKGGGEKNGERLEKAEKVDKVPEVVKERSESTRKKKENSGESRERSRESGKDNRDESRRDREFNKDSRDRESGKEGRDESRRDRESGKDSRDENRRDRESGKDSRDESRRDKESGKDESRRDRESGKDSRDEGKREEHGRREGEQGKERSKDREGLQPVGSVRQTSRSQSPALAELRTESLPVTQLYQEPASSTSSKHSSERSHHSKSHSRDLGSNPGMVNSSQSNQTTSRSMEDSPQKQLLGNLTSLTEYSGILNSPSGYHSANVSYGMSSDEFSSPQSGYRAVDDIPEHPEHPDFLPHPVLLSTLVQRGGQYLSDSDHSMFHYTANQVDEGDGAGSSGSSRATTAIAHLNSKVARTKDLIRLEQTIRDDNVNEYLKLAANADKQQLLRIKAVFEKKNQKSAHSISQLQKKLDGYHKRIKNWETHGSSSGQGAHRQPREMLRDMGQGLKNVGGNIRDGITGLGGTVMSKPREFAHLIKNKFGSADNINQMAVRNNWADGRRPDGEGAHTLPGNLRGAEGGSGAQPAPSSGAGGGSGGAGGGGSGHNKLTSEEGSECSSVTSSGCGYQNQNQTGNNNLNDVYSLKQIFCELKDRREDIDRICEKLDTIKTLSQEVSYLSSALQEERFRSERLEEQINDLTELHQNEVENLKQALADVEEKVQYQSEERVRDIHEMLELCQTKISKMEHQAMQQQQYVNLEGIEGFNARVLAVKLINVVLTVLQVVLLLVATAAGILMPFLRTRDDLKPKHYGNGPHSQSLFLHMVRILTTSMVVIGAVFILKQWPEVWEISSHLMEKLRKTIVHNSGDADADADDELQLPDR